MLDPSQQQAVAAWNLMGGEMKTDAMEWIFEYLEVADYELVIDALIEIVDFKR